MVEQTFTQFFAQDLAPAEMSRQLAAMAQGVLDETDAFNRNALGRSVPSLTYVDGVEGAKFSSVKPNGQIVREYELVPDAIPAIRDMLRAASPRLTGRYEASHTLFADGEEVPADAEIPVASVYVFASVVPYARKIERAKQVYERVAGEAQRRFGNSGSVRFTFYSVSDAPGTAIFARSARFARRPRREPDWFSRQPAIVVTVR